MSETAKDVMSEDAIEEAQLSSENLDEIAGGAQVQRVCSHCGQSDQVMKKIRRPNIMYYYCARCKQPI